MSHAVNAHIDAVKQGKAKLSTGDINTTIKEAGRPWKCEPADLMLVAKTSDVTALPSGEVNPAFRSAFRLIQNSPKTMQQLRELATIRKLGNPYFYSALRDSPAPMFAWIFPDVVRLIQRLRMSLPFLDISKDAGFDGLPDDQWMIEMTKSG